MNDKSDPFDGPQLQDTEYAAADMSRSNFNGVNLTEAKFYAVLSKARFVRSKLEGASFDDVNLHGARFHNVNLSGSTFDDINLSEAEFNYLNLSGTKITNANLEGMTINGILVTELLAAYEREQS